MNKNIFFRNDDVWLLDEKLERLINIFLINKVPLHLSVIPGKLTKECKDFLVGIAEKYPSLIEIGQHGLRHINYSTSKNKFSKYEFGEKRAYKEQRQDIIKGKKILESLTGYVKVFTPPWHGFDNNTLKILAKEGYSISTDFKKPLPNNIYNIRNMLTNVYLNKKNEKGWFIEKVEKIIQEIASNDYSNIGVQIHHEAFNGLSEFDQLDKLLQKLKKDVSFNLIRLSQAFKDDISKDIYPNSLIYYLTYQFVPKPLALTKTSKNPIWKEYDFQKILRYKLNELSKKTELELSRQLYLNLKKIIKKQLPKNNIPVGHFLSGGVDSAIILHILRELTSRDIYTITGAYSRNAPNLKFARQLAEKYKTIHKEIIISPKDLLKIEEIYTKNVPQPIGDNGFLSDYIMMNEARKSVDVVFRGDGADCLFSGLGSHYLNYIQHKYLEELDLSRFKNKEINPLMKSAQQNFEHYYYGELFLDKKEIEPVFNKKFQIDLEAPIKLVTKKIKTKDVLKKQVLLDLNFLVKNRVDYIICSAKAAKLKVKMPFLDKSLVNFAVRIPSKYLIKNLKQKYILRKAFEGKIPKEILDRDKDVFIPPFSLWYEQNRDFVIKKLLESTSLGISKHYIRYLIKNIGKSKNYQIGMRIWLILNLVCWFENQKSKF